MQTTVQAEPLRVGVVSFVNTLPLIDGLEGLANVHLQHSVPSLLYDQLINDEVDMALCSCIDYQRAAEPMLIVPVGLLGCEGATMTVRLYSTAPIANIKRVYCDTDSHTSIALMRILLMELHGIEPELIDYDAREQVAENKLVHWPEAMLLIGDKVVTDSPPAIRYPHQLDLGAAWAELTGLPFVFAVWMTKATADLDRIRPIAAAFDRQRRHNIERLDHIVHHRAQQRSWPKDLAEVYLKHRLAYEFTDRRRAGMELFFQKADANGLIEQLRPVEILAI